MNSSRRKRKVIRITIISLCSLATLVAAYFLSPYLVMHRYISKVNFVPLEEESSSQFDLQFEEPANGAGKLNNGRSASSLGQASLRQKQAVEASTDSGALSNQTSEKSGILDGLASDMEAWISSKSDAEETPEDREAADRLEESIRSNVTEAYAPRKTEKEVINLLLIGTDNRTEGARGLSDSMIILSIHPKAKMVTVASLHRDIYLYIPEKNSFNRLNTAYAYGGARLLLKTIEENLKVKIDKYASVDFYTFIGVIDALGGIELEITEEELPHVNAYLNELNQLQGKDKETDTLRTSGLQLLNGRQALGYSRISDVGTDSGRTTRQRMILEQIYKKTKKLGVKKTTELLDLLLPQITTNFSEKEIISILLSLPEYMEYGMDSFRIPIEGSYENVKIHGMQVLSIDFQKNIELLRKRIY